MRNILLSIFFVLALTINATNKPNIILFYVDDLGWMDLSCQGSQFYETPAIDQLAKEGMRFTNAYTAHPRCVPARYGVLTGRYPSRGKVPGGGELLPEDYTVAEALRDGGYHTYFTGKWHVLFQEGLDNMPENQGFDVNVAGGAAGSPPTYWYPYRKGASTPEGQQGLVKTEIHGLDEGGSEGEYITDRLTRETVNFIDSHVKERGKDEPFFVCFSQYGVHTPFEAKQELIDKYQRKLDTMTYDLPEYETTQTGDSKLRQDFPTYAAMIESVDQSMAALQSKLIELGIEDNTIIVFTADNGGLSTRGNTRELATSNYPLRNGKGWLNEGGIREAFIVKWPGVTTAGQITDEATIATDLYPTFLEMAELAQRPKDHLDGESIVKVLKGEAYVRTKPLYWHSPAARPESTGDMNSSALRHGDYKIIDWYDEGRMQLFNLKEDISESYDLSESMPGKKAEMMALLETTKKEVLNWEREDEVDTRYDFENFPYIDGFEADAYLSDIIIASYDGSTESDSWVTTKPQVIDRIWRGKYASSYEIKVSDEAHQGSKAIEINVITKIGESALKLRSVNIPEGSYKVSFYAKTDAAGLEKAKIGFSSQMVNLTTEYVKYESELTVKENSNGSTRLMIAFLSTDKSSSSEKYTIYFDDLVIEQLSSELSDVKNETEVNIFPNPSSGTIYFSGKPVEKVKLIDSNGKVCMTYNGAVSMLDVSHLAKGFYIVDVTTKTGETQLKLSLI